ncbi:hypothetical protein ACFOLF_31235 [Paenibacillus sepulcri]|uniref:Uncharacterized protein n=1 Tax=Paenibacillus sepulcri TaxID=359917 RepID=A0ABS7C1B3_9BACL|nr:hypothetical protein [Paenibacillus sepulcri]
MHKRTPLFAAIILLMVSSHVSAAAAAEANASLSLENPSQLQTQVRAWMDILSEQQQFHTWKNAESAIVPLGPGTHGYLVTIILDRQPIGYMIVNATEQGGYALGEYGVGRHPIFDPNTLYLSLVRQGLIESYAEATKKPLRLERIYVHPLLAVWKWDAPDGQAYYLDAWTGGALPVNDAMWQKQLSVKPLGLAADVEASTLTGLSGSRLNSSFDPYETMPWLTKSPLMIEQPGSLLKLLDDQAKLRYTAELFDQTVLHVWPAVGYHTWNDQNVYVAFDQQGTRYVPLEMLVGNGLFYQ